MFKSQFTVKAVLSRLHLNESLSRFQKTIPYLFQRTLFSTSILTKNYGSKPNTKLCMPSNSVLQKFTAFEKKIILDETNSFTNGLSMFSQKVNDAKVDSLTLNETPLSNHSHDVPSERPVSSESSSKKLHLSKLKIQIPEKPTSREIPSPVKRYFLGRYSKYLERFQCALANEMPDTFHMFSTFTNGFKDFVIDFRDYILVLMKLSIPSIKLRDLSRRELELWFNMPSQMFKVAPVIILSSFPLAQNVVLPISYWFPRYLLCYHFWDIKQKQDFGIYYLTKRLYNARPVFRSLQERLVEIKDPILKGYCQSVFYSLGSGIHPSRQEVLDLLELFNQEPFHINTLWSAHINSLLRLHNLSIWFRRQKRLYDHARYIHYLDKALHEEGLSLLDSEQLRNMMLLRGVNSAGMSRMEIMEYLENWINISLKLTKSSYSLLLHLPIFLAYNQPNNLILIYR